MKFAAWLGLIFWLAASAIADCGDQAVRIRKEQYGHTVRLVAESDHLLDYTITLEANLENMAASCPLPVTVSVTEKKAAELVELRVIDDGKAYRYHYTFNYRIGARGGVPDDKAVYLLPYLPSERHLLMQGYFGKFSHYAGSGNEYAYDWKMPVGTKVCAARGGVVVGVRQDSDIGGISPVFLNCANYIIIRQSDGTYAEYLHLEKDGVLVALGATVRAGQTIGLSGATGFASAPHLHFSVFRPIDGAKRETLPVAIKTKTGISRHLAEGQIY